jgi:hypothetical protein
MGIGGWCAQGAVYGSGPGLKLTLILAEWQWRRGPSVGEG